MTLLQQSRHGVAPTNATAFRRTLLALVGIMLTAGLLSGCNSRELGGLSHQLVNNERVQRGGDYLRWDDEAADKAQRWAEQMARDYAASHSDLSAGLTSNWRYLGENVGAARSIDEAHKAFMRSSAHRDTILSARYDRVGIGIAERNGMVFVAQVFIG